MDASAKKFFQDILETPSPSGYEQPVQEIVRKYVAGFADDDFNFDEGRGTDLSPSRGRRWFW